MKEKQLSRYLFWAFALAWALQAAAIGFAWNGQTLGFQLILGLSMYAPFAAVLLASIPLSGMGWRPRLHGKVRWYLAAWFGLRCWRSWARRCIFWSSPRTGFKRRRRSRPQLGEAGAGAAGGPGMTQKT